MNTNNHLHPNNQSEEHVTSDYGFNDSSESLQQSTDMTSYNCPNCYPTIGDDNLRMPYDNTVLERSIMSHHQVSLAQHSSPCSTHINKNVTEQVSPIMTQDIINSINQNVTEQSSPIMPQETINSTMQSTQSMQPMQCSSHSTPLQRYVSEPTSQHSPNIHPSSHCSHHDLRVNSSNMVELFKIELSGIEIVARQKLDLSQNYLETQEERNKQPQRNAQTYLGLEDHTRRAKSRMQPYHIPHKIINRYHTSGQQHYCSHFCPTMVDQQPDHGSRISAGISSLNSDSAQDTHANQYGNTSN